MLEYQFYTYIMASDSGTLYIGIAIEREKELKDWNRKRKEDLINSRNPTWRDISDELVNESS